jgi:zinc/manganese transport system substrate-binding protein
VLAALPLALATVLGLGACGGTSSPESTRPQVVVTFPVLGAVVTEVVGDRADVRVLMPNGADPHEWSPSAKDVSALLRADLVVENGLGLESNLQEPVREARARGAAVFTVADHVTLRRMGDEAGADHEHEAESAGADHEHGAADPHLWLDPLTTRQWIGPLADALRAEGVDVTGTTAAVTGRLDTLHAEITELLEVLPADRRLLVTGHESLGYLADRYGFDLVGAVIPASTSQAEASARGLADLARRIRSAGVPAVFTEIGTPSATVAAISRDTGARVVELPTHTLPADGTYRTFMLDLVTRIRDALR